jgi:hypothetical protein
VTQSCSAFSARCSAPPQALVGGGDLLPLPRFDQTTAIKRRAALLCDARGGRNGIAVFAFHRRWSESSQNHAGVCGRRRAVRWRERRARRGAAADPRRLRWQPSPSLSFSTSPPFRQRPRPRPRPRPRSCSRPSSPSPYLLRRRLRASQSAAAHSSAAPPSSAAGCSHRLLLLAPLCSPARADNDRLRQRDRRAPEAPGSVQQVGTRGQCELHPSLASACC